MLDSLLSRSAVGAEFVVVVVVVVVVTS